MAPSSKLKTARAPALASRRVDSCRICGSKALHPYLDLGKTPLANAYLDEAGLRQPEFREELCLQLCRECGLSQLTKVVHPDRMFKHYLYVSSTTETIREHFGELARTAARAAGVRPGDLALDVASNDGCLLRGLLEAGFEVIGVDPAENLAREANAAGLRTECAYWSKKVAERLARRLGRAKLVTACNVVGHADDLHEFMRAVSAVLAEGGIFVIECPYVMDLVKKGEFDTAYHEHLSYLSLTPLQALMSRHGFELFDVEYFPSIHGGTIRAYVSREGSRKPSARLGDFLARERSFGIASAEPYEAFARVVLDNRKTLRALIHGLREEGKTVWAYGASAKGNTLMNFFGLDKNQVPVAIDDNPKKWSLFTPGAHMKVAGIGALKKAEVDYLLLLAWNFENEIRRRCQAAGYAGGFILPVPSARIVPGGA